MPTSALGTRYEFAVVRYKTGISPRGDVGIAPYGGIVHPTAKHQATSKNCFLMVWVRDFVLTKVLKIPEYFVYCGIFKAHCQGKRSAQTAKG